MPRPLPAESISAVGRDRSSFAAIAWARDQDAGTLAAKALLMMLATYADKAGVCFPKRKTLAAACHVGLRTVSRAAGDLEARGLVARVESRQASGYKGHDWWILAPQHPDRGDMLDDNDVDHLDAVLELACRGDGPPANTRRRGGEADSVSDAALTPESSAALAPEDDLRCRSVHSQVPESPFSGANDDRSQVPESAPHVELPEELPDELPNKLSDRDHGRARESRGRSPAEGRTTAPTDDVDVHVGTLSPDLVPTVAREVLSRGELTQDELLDGIREECPDHRDTPDSDLVAALRVPDSGVVFADGTYRAVNALVAA